MSLHAIERAKERYGLLLSLQHVEEIAETCRCRRAYLVRKDHSGGEVWQVFISRIPCRVVYIRRDHVIATFLPPDEDEGVPPPPPPRPRKFKPEIRRWRGRGKRRAYVKGRWT